MAQHSDKKESQANNGKPQSEIVSLIDEAIALVPGTVVEISVLERYGGDAWKERMIAVREKLTDLRSRLAAVAE